MSSSYSVRQTMTTPNVRVRHHGYDSNLVVIEIIIAPQTIVSFIIEGVDAAIKLGEKIAAMTRDCFADGEENEVKEKMLA